MPAEIKAYIIEGSSLIHAATFRRLTVRANVTGIDATLSVSDPEVLWNCIIALNAIGYNLGVAPPSTTHTSVLLQQIVVRGFTTDGCVCDLIFESPVFGGPPTAYVRTERSYTQSLSANTISLQSGGRKQIKLTEWVSSVFATFKVTEDLATITYDRPMRAINVQGLSYGTPTWNIGGSGVAGHVNNAPWLGLNTGFWKIIEAETAISVYQGYYTYSLTAATRISADWSEFAILFNKETGEYVQVTDAEITNLNALPYLNDVQAIPGAAKIGPYGLANFPAIFGFVI